MEKQHKLFVEDKFRKNKLVEKETSIIAEVHQLHGPIKSYTNIHYPSSLSKRIFRDSTKVTHIVFKNTSDGSEWTVTKEIYNMEATKLDLTEYILTDELNNWIKEFKNGRNSNDLRFGQYIWCKYIMSDLFPNPDTSDDGFGSESPFIAYNQILLKLLK